MKKAKYAVDTKVPVSQTRNEIEQTLTKFGASSFVFAIEAKQAAVVFECQGRRVRFNLPLPKDVTETRTARIHRERWRALFMAIKSKLVAVDTEIETFEEAFLSHIVMADGSLVGDHARPALEQQYASGRMVPLLPAPAK